MLLLGTLQIPLVESRGFARDLGFYLRCMRHISDETTAIEAALAAVDYLAVEAPWGRAEQGEALATTGDRVGAHLARHGSALDAYNAAADAYNAFAARMRGPEPVEVETAAGNSAAPEAGTSGASSPPIDGPATPSGGVG